MLQGAASLQPSSLVGLAVGGAVGRRVGCRLGGRLGGLVGFIGGAVGGAAGFRVVSQLSPTPLLLSSSPHEPHVTKASKSSRVDDDDCKIEAR